MPRGTGADARRRRFTKIRAILAGGLVLGIGAAVTLATWNDSEYANGTFATSTFNIEGSTGGSTFTQHPDSGSVATLGFGTSAAGLSPGVTVYALFSVRTTSDTTVDGTLTVGTPTRSPADQLTDLTTGIVTIDGTTCDATAFAGGDPVTGPIDLTSGADGNPGTQVNFCLQAGLPDDAPSSDQGQETTITWVFTGESVS